MDDTKSSQVGLWFAIAGVSGVIALLSGLDTVLSKLPFILDPSFYAPPGTFAIYFLLILVLPLSIAVFVAALTKRSGIALYGSIAILFSSLVWRVITVTDAPDRGFPGLQFVAVYSHYVTYVALDIVLAGALLVLTILQHRRRQLSEPGAPLGGGAAGRVAAPIICTVCGTPGTANQFCQGCGSKLQPQVSA